MRITFFILLFANLAFLAWAQWIDVPEPAGQNAAIARLPRLKLVSELPPEVHPTPSHPPDTSSTASPQASSSPASSAVVTQCLSVGPFPSEANSARISSLLRDKGLEPHERTEEGEVADGYWVYIGGVSSDADSDRIIRNLQRNGIVDAHAMSDSADGRRVSVGLFADEDRADRRAKAVQKLGLQAEVSPRKLPGTVHWVDVTVSSGAPTVVSDDLSGVSADTHGVAIGVQPCPDSNHQPAENAPPALSPYYHGSPGTRTPSTTVAKSTESAPGHSR